MKKTVCVFLSIVLLLSAAACGKEQPDPTATTTTVPGTQATTIPQGTYAWPDNSLFGDVPAPHHYVDHYISRHNDNGYTYEFTLKNFSYERFRAYIAELEAAGFNIFDPSGFNILKTEDLLPETLPQGTDSASWSGNRRGLYVVAIWNSEEFYTNNNLEFDFNLKLTFCTYNPNTVK